MRYHIIGHDNRGTDSHPFGYIYLATRKDGECVGRIGYGSHRDDPDPYAIWSARDNPGLGRDPFLADNAKAYLRKLYPNAVRWAAP